MWIQIPLISGHDWPTSETPIIECWLSSFVIFQEIRISIAKLEDLKVLRRSPDLLNNCKTGQGQLQLIMKHILFYHIWGLQPFWSTNINNLTAQ